uniref:Uncharacterized protein n=1 Tax=CrAss-like virus sp. ctYsL76 TaxID=2826826 RepID=A0A8S5QM49_9CAUD|nr:MAG TPA: hypothetical protein [CrAss-like virus sp. ctYsL76]
MKKDTLIFMILKFLKNQLEFGNKLKILIL